VAALVAVAGCGSGDSTGTASKPASTTDIVISGDVNRHIKCPGAPECARLAKTTVDDFAPVPPDVACTQIYGGDAKAHVEGTLGGKKLSADFDLHNGCEIDRWNKFDWLLGKQPAGPSGPD
jgi:hypothetical protein